MQISKEDFDAQAKKCLGNDNRKSINKYCNALKSNVFVNFPVVFIQYIVSSQVSSHYTATLWKILLINIFLCSDFVGFIFQ